MSAAQPVLLRGQHGLACRDGVTQECPTRSSQARADPERKHRISDAEQGLAAGLFNTGFQIGGAVVVSIVSAVITSHTEAVGGGEAHGILDAMSPALIILIALAVCGVLAIFAPLLTRRVPASGEIASAEAVGRL